MNSKGECIRVHDREYRRFCLKHNSTWAKVIDKSGIEGLTEGLPEILKTISSEQMERYAIKEIQVNGNP